MTASVDTPGPVASQPAASGLLPPGLVFADTPSRLAAYVLDSFLVSAIASIPPAFFEFYDYAYTGSPYPEPISRGSFIALTLFSFAVWAA